MKLEIVSPEAVIFNANVDSVSVPGINGEFQMLENHAPIVSLLIEGVVKVHTHTQDHEEFSDLSGRLTKHPDDDKILIFPIKSGTIELKDNNVIILAD
ncbi:F0F1 ATP synthase subunit epsilon [Aureibaculum algae]|uniref:F0F1 ATP synthase subunit epsilon n=1 Tax=Aureibaculum algae TaxID=2584122 RepID=A0A5B7TXU9_9FLAO|nr:F0F1 ATP synthase subunit epsilon [Aureibaculum algae]QCX40183.1 F0F1 ATP synthase subunit epsilon [Aureibaculum algae]